MTTTNNYVYYDLGVEYTVYSTRQSLQFDTNDDILWSFDEPQLKGLLNVLY